VGVRTIDDMIRPCAARTSSRVTGSAEAAADFESVAIVIPP